MLRINLNIPKMSEQRVPFSVREEARQALTDWFSDRIDVSLFNQLAGNTGQSDTRYTGNNAAVAPTATTNWVYANGVANETQVASASASNVFVVSMIDALVERAKTNTPKIRPLKVNGKDKYALFIHPYQVVDMRRSTSTGQWLDIQKAVYQGAKDNNPIYNGALGEYNGVVIHESTRVPAGLVSGVYRAVFLGAQSGVVAFGQKQVANRPNWYEELFDYGNQLGVAASMIWGAKKCVFNSVDFSTIVLSTYAAAH